VWFKLKEQLDDVVEFACWIWIITSIGGTFVSPFIMIFNQSLGFILTLSFFIELMLPILWWSRGAFIFELLFSLPSRIAGWFEDRYRNYQEWKTEKGEEG
jgi:hypothetical protein